MEITRHTHNLINYHRAEIVSPLYHEQMLEAIAEITEVQEPRFGRPRHARVYQTGALFTGILSAERIELYWWKPLYPRKHFRIRGKVSGTMRSVLSLKGGGTLFAALEIIAMMMAVTIMVLALRSDQPGNNPFRFIVIFVGGLTWFFIASRRRRNAFDAAVASIAEAIASREPESDMPGEPGRAVSSRKQ